MNQDDLGNLDSLYREKGELTTQFEVISAKLRTLNMRIIEILNKKSNQGTIENIFNKNGDEWKT